MDAKDLIKLVQQSREYEFKCNGSRTYKLRLPSEHEARIAYLTCVTEGGEQIAGFARASRMMLEQSLIGWEGIKMTDLVPDAPAPLPVGFTQMMVPIVLDALDDDAVAMINDMADRLSARAKRLEGELKN